MPWRLTHIVGFFGMFDPLVHGDYPSEMRKCGLELPRFSHNEKQLLRGSIDFIGFNHYSTLYVKDCIHSACPLGGDHAIRGFFNTTGYRDGVPIGEPTGMPRFFVVPRGMEKMLDYLKQRYNNKPMFITENGYSSPTPQTELQDWNRIKFHKAYMASVARAIRNGADVRGYSIWSLMDNFEWLSGYTTRFGLYYVDRKTQDGLLVSSETIVTTTGKKLGQLQVITIILYLANWMLKLLKCRKSPC